MGFTGFGLFIVVFIYIYRVQGSGFRVFTVGALLNF